MTVVHRPVLLMEVIGALAPSDGGIYIDATVGLGGHSEEILKYIGQNGLVIGIDRDEEALSMTANRINDNRLVLKKGGFSSIDSILYALNLKEVDGILFDLGVSMMQLKMSDRGFSFNSDAMLDMRMDHLQPVSALDVVNTYPEKELVRIIREYGEEYRAERIARAIVEWRKRKRIETCRDLANIISSVVTRTGRLHPATKTFQALRIEVNQELEELKKGLDCALRLLKKGGRLCVISYHSLEDRIVKNFIRDNKETGLLRSLYKKVVVPGINEIRENPAARSAKLRAAERL